MGKMQLMVKSKTEEKSHNIYGEHLYFVKVTQKIAKEYEITVRADGYNIDNAGILTFFTIINDDCILNTLSFTPDNWSFVYLAEEQGQYPAAVERWNGVANVRIIEKEVTAKKEVIKEVVVATENEPVIVPTETQPENTQSPA